MKKNKLFIKNLLINKIMLKGRKHTSEKILLKCFKTLHKSSNKKQEQVIKLFLINILPIFKLHKSSNKKVRKKKRKVRIMPVFILKNKDRLSLGIKTMFNSFQKKENNYFFENLVNAILQAANGESFFIETKNEIQKTALKTKRYIKNFKYY